MKLILIALFLFVHTSFCYVVLSQNVTGVQSFFEWMFAFNQDSINMTVGWRGRIEGTKTQEGLQRRVIFEFFFFLFSELAIRKIFC